MRLLGSRTLIMGVLNVTPDSFSDGGLFLQPSAAKRHAWTMIEDGADIIDIGGESTRPSTFKDGATLSVDEELRRIIPAIEGIAREFPDFPLSVDTYKSKVAERALEAGATIINDVSGLTYDPLMAEVAAKHNCPLILMHILGKPHNISDADYGDVMEDVLAFLDRQVKVALAAGVSRSNIVVDPGIGFGKNADHNLTILRRLTELKSLGYPIMIGPSRKRFLALLLGNAAAGDRLEGSAASVAIGIANGAAIVRVHDVKSMARVARVADAIVRVND